SPAVMRQSELSSLLLPSSENTCFYGIRYFFLKYGRRESEAHDLNGTLKVCGLFFLTIVATVGLTVGYNKVVHNVGDAASLAFVCSFILERYCVLRAGNQSSDLRPPGCLA